VVPVSRITSPANLAPRQQVLSLKLFSELSPALDYRAAARSFCVAARSTANVATEPFGSSPEELADFEKYTRLTSELNIRTN